MSRFQLKRLEKNNTIESYASSCICNCSRAACDCISGCLCYCVIDAGSVGGQVATSYLEAHNSGNTSATTSSNLVYKGNIG